MVETQEGTMNTKGVNVTGNQFYQIKNIFVFFYNFLFYRGRRGLMVKRPDGCTRIRIYASSRYFLSPYVDL